MEFSLSWLADYVDLPLRLEADASGRHRFAAADGRGREEEKEKSFHIGKKLTAVGLAVEGLAEHPLAVATAIAGQAPGEGAFDLVLDIDVTSNRPDCMCHFGVARELAVALDQPLKRPSVPIYGSFSSDGSTGAVLLEDPEGCPRYVARIIRGVKIGPSPEWLKNRLEAIGQRSINNVVDVTNFVLWEMGQPLHAFDLSTLPGGEIRVRRALPGERLTTLDGKVRDLDPEVLVIADRTRAVALAGVMGGLDTEVTGSTVDLLLESAHFDRRRVRVGAKRLGLHTDASHRFERGTDPLLCDEASCRAAALIVEVAGGRVEEPAVDAVALPHVPVGWRLDGAALDRFVGAEIPAAEIERILAALGFAPRRLGARGFEGTVPGFRAVDFQPRRGPAGGAYPQDLYEEVLRHWGFDRVAATLPGLAGVDPGASPGWERRARVQGCFAALGFAEGIHFAFHDRAADERLPALVAGPAPALANPLSDRYAVMRRSLVPNLAAAAEFNLDRDATAVRLFEVGHLFPGAGGDEIEAVAAAIAGVSGTPWDRHPAADLAELKGAFEALLEELGAEAETRARRARRGGLRHRRRVARRRPRRRLAGADRGDRGAAAAVRGRAAARSPAGRLQPEARASAVARAGHRGGPDPDARGDRRMGGALPGDPGGARAAARGLPPQGPLPGTGRARGRGGDHDHLRLPRGRPHTRPGRSQRAPGLARRSARAALRCRARGGGMSLEFLDPLEARVTEAIDRLTALDAENDELRRRVVELEAELASRAETPAAWKKEREEVRKRVQRLVEKLATLG